MLVDFMIPKWAKEKSYFDKEIMGYDPKTKKDIPWHYSNQEYRDHLNWLKQVQDPITKQFFKGKSEESDFDSNGEEIPGTKRQIELEPYFQRKQIVRIRSRDGKEYLYSRGYFYGYTLYGERISHSFQEPEVWTQQLFRHHMEFIPKDSKHMQICDGPAGSIIHYTIPFTLENVDLLMKDATPDVSLTVLEEGGGMAKQARNIDEFRNKSFNYNKNMEYLTEKERAEKLEEFQAIQSGTSKKK